MSRFMDRCDAIDEACGHSQPTVRVHCGDLRERGASCYACDDCETLVAKALRTEYPDLDVEFSPMVGQA